MSIYVFREVYFIFTIISCFLISLEYKLKYQTKVKIVICFALIVSIFYANRPISVADTETYINWFENYRLNISLSSWRFGSRLRGMEYGYLILMDLIQKVTKSYKLYFWIINVFSTFLLIKGFIGCEEYIGYKDGCKDTSKRTPIFAIWACFMLYYSCLYTCISIRAGLSMGIGIYGISLYLKKQKVGVALVTIIFSTMMHTAGIIFFPIFFVLSVGRGITKKFFLLFWMILLFLLYIKSGMYFAELLVKIITSIRVHFHIASFSSYTDAIDTYISKSDWYRLVIVGMLTMFLYKDKELFKKYALIIMIGLITSVMAYTIPAISRLFDYFLLFMIPSYASKFRTYNSSSLSSKQWMFMLMLVLLLPLQFVTCFY